MKAKYKIGMLIYNGETYGTIEAVVTHEKHYSYITEHGQWEEDSIEASYVKTKVSGPAKKKKKKTTKKKKLIEKEPEEEIEILEEEEEDIDLGF